MTDNAAPRNRGKPGFTSAVREVVLIVVGVLIALSLEGLWQDRNERIAERSLLLGLTNEFVDNSRALSSTVGGHHRIVASAEEFIAQVEAAQKPMTSADHARFVSHSMSASPGREPAADGAGPGAERPGQGQRLAGGLEGKPSGHERSGAERLR